MAIVSFTDHQTPADSTDGSACNNWQLGDGIRKVLGAFRPGSADGRGIPRVRGGHGMAAGRRRDGLAPQA